jgi:serine-type D-Ala-D-Ala carboxypeptidase (penicillin-binding protein 5/6)
MKYVSLAILALMFSISSSFAMDSQVLVPAATNPNVGAESSILVDATTGQVLYEKNDHAKRPIASTTKIMTAILVIEHAKLDDVVIASKRASMEPFTSLHLVPGEKMKVHDLLEALLIRSANDTAVALAEHVGGSVEHFADMMNAKAKEIGANETHFITPNGLYVPGHYSTAYDLAIMARYAMRYPIFNEIIAMRRTRIERSINTQDVLVRTSSKFMKNYEGADGVKSGYIKQAGHCFVGSATRGGWRLLSVVLKSPNSAVDTESLMNYGFGNFERIVLSSPYKPVDKVAINGGKSRLDIVPALQLHAIVRRGESSLARSTTQINDKLYAPIRKGEKVGTMTAYVGDKAVAIVDLDAAESVDQTIASRTWPWVRAMMLAAMISIGVAGGRAASKSNGLGRRWFS